MPSDTDDIRFLKRALELAREGSQRGEGGPFGAVLVKDGQIIAEGWNRVVASHDPTAHAEIAAIRTAAIALGNFHLHGCTLYASSEPCPMCLSAAYWAQLERVVYANPRHIAAEIGFSDADLYLELSAPPANRRLPLIRIELPDADAVMHAWRDTPGHIDY